uniref:hypothetical protein n=1 Tax=Paracoccus sp. TRP TaxID=412597 RepID=UPI000225FBC7|nr:hypothetical protein [Paracoccus sp. TRP]
MHRATDPSPDTDLQAEILALKLVLTPIVGAILDAPSVLKHYEYLLSRARQERRTAPVEGSALDETTFRALLSAEQWLSDMSSDYLERKLEANRKTH